MISATHSSPADPLQAAQRLAAEGHSAQALTQCESLIRVQPGNVAARLLGATLALSAGRADSALEHLDAADWYLEHDARQVPDETIEQLLLRGKALMQLRKPDDACAVWRQVLRLQPRHPQALRLLAGALELTGHLDQAIACLEHALLILPGPRKQEHGRTLKALADLCERDGQYERALALLERFDMADDASMQWRMVRLLRRAGRSAEAMERLTLLCRRYPDNIALSLHAAELAGELGREIVVLRHAFRAMSDPSTRAGAMRVIASQHLRCGRLAKAGRWWWRLSRAYPAAPHAAPALAALAVCATLLERDRLAARATRMLGRLADSKRRAALLSEAWLAATPARLLLQQQAGELGAEEPASVLSMLLNEATETLEQRAEAHPGYADVHHHLAVCRRQLGQHELASSEADKALRINGSYADAAMLRATLLIEQGATEAALAVVNATLTRKPGHAELTALAGAIDVMLGRPQQAAGRIAEREDQPQLREQIDRWLERLGRESDAGRWRSAA